MKLDADTCAVARTCCHCHQAIGPLESSYTNGGVHWHIYSCINIASARSDAPPGVADVLAFHAAAARIGIEGLGGVDIRLDPNMPDLAACVDCLACGRVVPFTIGGVCRPCDDTDANVEAKIRARIKALSDENERLRNETAVHIRFTHHERITLERNEILDDIPYKSAPATETTE